MFDADLIDRAQKFYRTLAQNNSRDWWQDNRATYDTAIKPAAEAMLAEITPRLSELTGEQVYPKLFRPYRDTRFSKDKTPYKEHLHIAWMIREGRQETGYFFGIEPDRVLVGGGMMGMDKAVLEDWRKFVDLDAKRVAAILEQVEGAGFTLREPELVRAPRGYPVDHPLSRLLRMKAVIALRPLEPSGDITDQVMEGFAAYKPLGDLLLSVSCA